MIRRRWTTLAVCCLLTTASFADLSYQETTQITGGSLVGLMKFAGVFSKDAKQATQPTTSTVLFKGNRMANITPDSTEIIDLDAETFTNIDHKKKQYTTITFEQMKQQLEEARKKAEQQARQSREQPSREQGVENQAQWSFNAQVRNTGATKDVAGMQARHSILAMTMEATDQESGQKGGLAITNDMWMAAEIPGYEEVQAFNERMAQKMGMILSDAFGPAVAALQPGSAEAISEMVNEMSKLEGVPVSQITRMGMATEGQPLLAASEAPLPQSSGPEMPSAGEVAKKSTASAISGRLGRFGGLGRRRQQEEEQPKPETAEQGQTPTANVLIESRTDMSGFSSAMIDPVRFEVPAGYKQVQPRR